MEEVVTQGVVQTALTCIEESYFVGDVIIAPSAVIGSGVVLRADPGCLITIRDGVCLGPGVIIHASQGAIELHQGVCLAGDVLILGKGTLGKQVCIGTGATLINPVLAEAAVVSAYCLWGDESRQVEEADTQGEANSQDTGELDPTQAEFEQIAPTPATITQASETVETSINHQSHSVAVETSHVISNTVIGKQQFELMLQKMFPEREAFKRSQAHQ